MDTMIYSSNFRRRTLARNYPVNPTRYRLAMAIAIVWDLSWVGFIQWDQTRPAIWMAIFTLPPLLVLRIIFYRQLIEQAHALHRIGASAGSLADAPAAR